MLSASVETCRHHWLLGEPQGGVVPGACKLCGALREYPARLEHTEGFFDHEELLRQTRPLAPIYAAPADESA